MTFQTQISYRFATIVNCIPFDISCNLHFFVKYLKKFAIFYCVTAYKYLLDLLFFFCHPVHSQICKVVENLRIFSQSETFDLIHLRTSEP